MILLTGAHGFLGEFVSSKLTEKNIPFLQFIKGKRGIQEKCCDPLVYYGNLNNAGSIKKVMENVERVIHLASTLSTDLDTVMDYDVKGMGFFVDAWKRGDFIFASSFDVYSETENAMIEEDSISAPSNYYGLGKLACEKILQMRCLKDNHSNSKLTYKILRLPYILGKQKKFPGSLFGKMIQRALAGDDFYLDDTCSGTSWISADEVASFIASVQGVLISGIYNLANGWIFWAEAIEQIIKATNSNSRLIVKENPNKHTETKGKYLDIKKAQKDFGYQPKKTFQDVVQEILELKEFSEY